MTTIERACPALIWTALIQALIRVYVNFMIVVVGKPMLLLIQKYPETLQGIILGESQYFIFS